MINFDVVSQFTNVPIVNSLELLSQHFEYEVLALFEHVLTLTYFCFDGQFYEQTDGWLWAHHFCGNCEFLHGGF